MNSKFKTALVTGGTGFIGRPLCEQLIKSGLNKLYVFTRNQSLINNNSDSKIQYIQQITDLNDAKIDLVINLAGETISQRWTDKAKLKIYDSRISTTREIVNYIKSSKVKPKLFISGSAVGYYGNKSNQIFDEYTVLPKNSEGFAQKLCRDWEKEAMQAEKLGVRLVLLRIAPVMEKNGGMLSKLLPSFYMGLGGKIGDGKQYLSWIDRDDLINLILFVIANSKISGPINASSPNPITNEHFSKTLAKALNRPCIMQIPGFILKIIFSQMAEEIMLNGQKVLPKKALDNDFKFQYPTIEKSLNKIFS